MEEEDNVIPLRKRSIENINGVAMDLGRMATEDLRALEIQCTHRFIQAMNELSAVRDHLLGRFPDHDGGGAA